MNIFYFFRAGSVVISNCIGSGAFTSPTLLIDFGINAFFGWILTTLGAFSMGMIFLSLAEGVKGKEISLHTIIASSFTKNTNMVKKMVFYLYILFVSFSNAALAMLVHAGCKDYVSHWACYACTFILMYLMNRWNLEISRTINIILSAIKTLLLIALPLSALMFLTPLGMPEDFYIIRPMSVLKAGMVALWPFVGVESIAIDSGMKISYLKKGLALGTTICFIIYTLNTYCMFFYLPDLKNFDIADQSLIAKIAPSLMLFVNTFIVFLGISCLQGWTQSVISTCKSTVAPSFLYRHANLLCCTVGLLSSLAIKYYRSDRSFSFVFDLATILLLIIYCLGLVAFALNWKKNGLPLKGVFFIALAYLVLMLVCLGASLM